MKKWSLVGERSGECWRMRQNFVDQFVLLPNRWLCGVHLGVVVKNWALSVDQCWLQALQFSVQLIDLLSILHRCNGFTGIQKAVVDQTGSRPPNSDYDLSWCKFDFGKSFGVSSESIHWAGHLWLSYTIHFLSHVTIRSRNGLLLCRIREDDTSEWWFLHFWSAHDAPTYKAFSPFQFALHAKQLQNGQHWVLQQLLV